MASGNLTCYSLTCFLSPGMDFLCATLDALWEMKELSLLSRVLHRHRYQTSVAVPLETGLSGSPFPCGRNHGPSVSHMLYLNIMWCRQTSCSSYPLQLIQTSFFLCPQKECRYFSGNMDCHKGSLLWRWLLSQTVAQGLDLTQSPVGFTAGTEVSSRLGLL